MIYPNNYNSSTDYRDEEIDNIYDEDYERYDQEMY